MARLKFILLLQMMLFIHNAYSFVNSVDQIPWGATQRATQEEYEYLINEFEGTYQLKTFGSSFPPLKVERDFEATRRCEPRVKYSGKSWDIRGVTGSCINDLGLTKDGFLLMMCHELGHFFGGIPIKSMLGSGRQMISVEGQADYWSTQVCAKMLWRDKYDENVLYSTYLKGQESGRTILDRCNAVWDSENDRNLCYRTLLAAASVGRALAYGLELSIEESDPSRPQNMMENHPNPQCRLDTLMAGGLCNIFPESLKEKIPGVVVWPRNFGTTYDFPEGMEQTDGLFMSHPRDIELLRKTSCFEGSGHSLGERPSCWFKPGAKADWWEPKKIWDFVTQNAISAPVKSFPLEGVDSSKQGFLLRQLSGAEPVSDLNKPYYFNNRAILSHRNNVRSYLSEYFTKMGYEVEVQRYSSQGANLIIQKKGILAEGFLAVSAHLDSVMGPGADDNASGMVAIMSIADMLKDLTPQYTIKFIFFDQEEPGRLGSINYFNKIQNSGELHEMIGLINLDMIGYDGNKDRIVNIGSRLWDDRSWAPLFQKISEHLGNKIKIESSVDHFYFGESDHNSLDSYSLINWAFVTEDFIYGVSDPADINPCYHRDCDTADKIDYEYLKNITELVGHTVYQMVY